MESNVFLKYRNNGNWTEWSAIRSQFIRVILKSDKYALSQKYDFRPKVQDRKLNYHFITAI